MLCAICKGSGSIMAVQNGKRLWFDCPCCGGSYPFGWTDACEAALSIIDAEINKL